jgi:uncharacterized protein YyaL (SSP411 family)
MNNYSNELELVENWLLQSGIQDQSKEEIKHGGVYAWYDKRINSYSFLYSEITGYHLTWLTYEYMSTKNDVCLSRANDAAMWLVERALDTQTGGVLCRHDGENWRYQICAFCNGMVLNGLCNAYKISANKKVLKTAISVGNCLLRDMQKDNGSFYSKYDPNSKEASNPGGKWSLISGAFLVKLSIGLLHLADITGDASYKEAATELCDWGLGFQKEDGRFSTSPDPEDTFLHPHCYAAEGMLVAGLILNEKRFIESAKKAVSWISNSQLDSGGFPSYYSKGLFKNQTSPDMTAQVLRLWLMLKESERPKIDFPAAMQSIISLQSTTEKSPIYGGIMAGDAWFTEVKENSGLSDEHINSWVSMFSAQAIRMSSEPMIDPFHMV